MYFTNNSRVPFALAEDLLNARPVDVESNAPVLTNDRQSPGIITIISTRTGFALMG